MNEGLLDGFVGLPGVSVESCNMEPDGSDVAEVSVGPPPGDAVPGIVEELLEAVALVPTVDDSRRRPR